ncbi:MAG: hypothetical protein DLM59_17935 [Pseudonocardiales bacterium]|nr:MAG: hypothetical protein DLM59_17935 [Pseudonocardiales bacterium]
MSGHGRIRGRQEAAEVAGSRAVPRAPTQGGPVAALDAAGVLALQRAAGNTAATIVLRQKADEHAGFGTPPSNPTRHDSIVIWFDRDSDALRKDAGTAKLVADTIMAVRVHLANHKGAQIVIAGYASAEGDAEHNRLLSERRAWTIKRILEAAGVPEEQLADVGHGADSGWPDRGQNRRVEIELPVDSEANADTPRHDKRPITSGEEALLARLDRLANFVGSPTPEAVEFALAVLAFEGTLRQRIEAVSAGHALPEDVRIALQALYLWDQDNGRTWGHAESNAAVNLTAPRYATVAGHMNKCNIYVAEVLSQTVGTVQQVYESDRQRGRYFPYRAEDWGDTAKAIPEYPVAATPKMGDIWSNGQHVGIYLGSYRGRRMYISARNDTDNVFGIGELQREHGLQIKFLPDGGVMRHHVAGATTTH